MCTRTFFFLFPPCRCSMVASNGNGPVWMFSREPRARYCKYNRTHLVTYSISVRIVGVKLSGLLNLLREPSRALSLRGALLAQSRRSGHCHWTRPSPMEH
jgi:hypothetical protein